MTDHTMWEEQAAGYSLDALDDRERAEFEAHLSTCAQCREQVDAHALVAAQLGSLAGDGVAAPPWSAIRDGVVDATRDADVVVMPHRRRNALLAAAAAVVVVAAGLTTWQVSRGSATAQPLASVAACRHASTCHVVPLRAGNSTRASVLVDGDRYTLVNSSMPSPPTGRVWALWQVSRQGGPLLLTTFTSSVHPARLKTALDATSNFAVSEEPADTVPASPHQIVANSGQLS